MFATAVIVFRETLEAALIVSIVLAATRGVAGRRRWIGGGVVAGIAAALVIAGLTGVIAGALEGIGQELFNGLVERHAARLLKALASPLSVTDGNRVLTARQHSTGFRRACGA